MTDLKGDFEGFIETKIMTHLEDDPISVDRTLRDVKAHLPREKPTRRRRDSSRRERLRGIINYRGHGERLSVAKFRAHLAFAFCNLRIAHRADDARN